MYCIKLFVFIFIILFTVSTINSKIIEGEMITDQNWAFLTRFCFFSDVGRFNYQILYPSEYQTQNLLMYYDSKQQWPSVYKSKKSCEEKESVLSLNKGQIIYLTPNYDASGCVSTSYTVDYDNNSTKEIIMINCTHSRVFKSIRERWWFMAISNCKSTKGLRLKYRIVMTNHESNFWLKHFSADQSYILQVDLVFTIIYYLLFIASCFEAYALNVRHLFHVTYKIYLASLLFQCLGLTFLTIHYVFFASNGFGINLLKLFGQLLQVISTILFLLLLILLAKGYTITRGRLKSSTLNKIKLFMSLYSLIYASIFFYEQKFFDPGEVLYLYESWPGYCLIFLRIFGWGWFVYAIVFTLIHYPSKSAFFSKLFLLYSVWFISAPIIILISTYVVPKWMREKIINAVELFIAFQAHVAFFILTLPSKANKNFPFHVRTTQIDVMFKTGEAGDERLDHFSHYRYAPSKNPSQPSYHSDNPLFFLTHIPNGNGNNNYMFSFKNNENPAFPSLPDVDSDTRF